MAEITSYQAIPIRDLLGDLSRYRNNPSLIQRRIIDHLEDIVSGQIDVVDPTNPFVFLLEASCVNTALAIQENTVDLRKAYPALMQTQEDAYLHMSDQDYLDRFSVPATATFSFYMELNSLLNNLVDVPDMGYYKATIPRNTEITVDGMTFSLQYPIDVIRHYSGIFQLKYNTETLSPLQALTTNIIEYTLFKDASNVQWVVFKVPLTQFKITNVEFPVQLSRAFVEDIVYTDSFYTARVYYRQDISSPWTEIRTTHTDQIYDPYIATAVLKVFDGFVRVFIPPVYTTKGLVAGTIRIDVYGTKGKIDINFSNYQLSAFETVLMAFDKERDINTYTNAFARMTYFAMTEETVTSGTNGYDFETLREAILMNSIGDRQLPITQSQIEYTVNTRGFDLHKHIDVITDRVFVASKNLPASVDRYPITPISTTVATLIESVDNLRQHAYVTDNLVRLTIPSYTLFELKNGQLGIVDEDGKNWLNSLPQQEYLEAVNEKTYLVNPFHYVLDFKNEEFDLRAYSLDYPAVRDLNFIFQNAGLSFVVNTGSYTIRKETNGYRITIVTKSGEGYKALDNHDVGVQITYTPPGEKLTAYMNASYIGNTSDGERVFECFIETKYDVDENDYIQLTNFAIQTNSDITLSSLLEQSINILHYTRAIPTGYKPTDTDQLLGWFLFNEQVCVVTHETITLHFGHSLKNFWRHYRSSIGGRDYQVYDHDVPMFYETDIYQKDPQTGMVFTLDDNCTFRTNLLHRKGDVVLDDSGNIVYKYRKGDTKRDKDGNPLLATNEKTLHYMDLVLVDYRAHAATRADHKAYLDQVVKTMVSWIVDDMSELNNILLEQTRIYYLPKKNIGQILVLIADGVVQHINLLQSMRVQYYVKNAVYNNMEIRESIDYRTIKIISEQLTHPRVSIVDILRALKDEFGDSIDTVNVSGLGGDYDLKLCYVQEPAAMLALNKILVRQTNGELSLNEDVTIEYIDIEH